MLEPLYQELHESAVNIVPAATAFTSALQSSSTPRSASARVYPCSTR